MSEEMIEPCPFCGKAPELLFNHQTDSGECWSVECNDCDIDRWGDYLHSTEAAKKSAIASWNKRSAYNPNERLREAGERVELVDRIKQLRAERKRYFDVEGDGVDVLLIDIQDHFDRSALSPLPQGED